MRLRWSVLVLGIAACGDGGEQGGAPIWQPDAAAATPATPSNSGTSATSTPATTPSASGPSNGGTPEQPSTNPTASSGGLPCDVQAILKDKCQTCHGDPLASGPMKLITHDNLTVPSTEVAGTTVAQQIQARIHDTDRPMPPAARPQLTADEIAVLDAYLAQGAPVSSETCSAPAAPTDATATGEFGQWLPPDSDCEVMYEMRAHGGQTEDDTTPFEAPTGGDHYEIFYFKPSWTEKMHVIRIDPITDNGAVLHHWLLYMEDGNGSGAGTHQSDLGLQGSESQLLSGWAPGNKQIALGKEVGMQVISGPDARFAVEFHYNTDANPPNRMDRSGINLCLTSKLRPKEAGTHWLGTNVIANLLPLGGTYEAGDTCTPKAESHIIAYSPHMHTYGRAQKSVVTHPDGSTEVINDGPFDFNDQQIYPIENAAGEIVVKPGDVITTTCYYDGSATFTFGPGTSQEMCYNFIVAWPVGSLTNGNPGVVGGKNSCIDTL